MQRVMMLGKRAILKLQSSIIQKL